jgi:putative heme-binding domain-containing protein
VEAHGKNRAAAAILLLRDDAERAAVMPIVAEAIKPNESIETQRGAIQALTETGDSKVPELLLRDWTTHGPQVRGVILEALFGREEWILEMLKRIPSSDIGATHRERFARHKSAAVREAAAKVFTPSSSNRAKVIEDFRPALQLAGDAARGKEIYDRACIICHERDSQGNDIGPDLRSVTEHPPEKLLVNILDPSVDIQPGYHAYNCTLTNGEELYGLIASETGNSIILKLADGSKKNILRKDIATLRSSNLSLMPEGLENSLSKQGLADLIAYLRAR